METYVSYPQILPLTIQTENSSKRRGLLQSLCICQPNVNHTHFPYRAAIDDWLQTQSSKTLNIDTPNTYLKRIVYQIINDPYVSTFLLSVHDHIAHSHICCRKYNGFLAAKSPDRRQMQIRKLTDENRKSRAEVDQQVCDHLVLKEIELYVTLTTCSH